jgi:hypothetical protein
MATCLREAAPAKAGNAAGGIFQQTLFKFALLATCGIDAELTQKSSFARDVCIGQLSCHPPVRLESMKVDEPRSGARFPKNPQASLCSKMSQVSGEGGEKK